MVHGRRDSERQRRRSTHEVRSQKRREVVQQGPAFGSSRIPHFQMEIIAARTACYCRAANDREALRKVKKRCLGLTTWTLGENLSGCNINGSAQASAAVTPTASFDPFVQVHLLGISLNKGYQLHLRSRQRYVSLS